MPFIGAIGLLARLPGGRATAPACEAPARILIVRVDLLGDVLFTMPLAEALRRHYPRAEITMLTLPYTRPLVALYPAVGRALSVDTNRIRTIRGLIDPRTWREYVRVYRELRRVHFDVAISVYGHMGSLWAWLSGARRTVGFAAEAYPFLLSDPVEGGRHQERMHEVEYVRRLAAHVGAPMLPAALQLRAPLDAIHQVDDMLRLHGVVAGEAVIVVHAGSINGSAKRWPAPQWAKFSDRLQREESVRVVLTGSAGDALIAEEVQRLADLPIVSLAGATSVPQLVALLQRATVVASGDSGPLHLALAQGRPVAAVYGPTDPVIYGPYHPSGPVKLLRADLPCSPCYTLATTAECPLGDPICMRLVSVDQMVGAVKELLVVHLR